VNSILALFYELGQAGFVLEREIKDSWYKWTEKKFINFGDLNVATMFEEEKIFNCDIKKKDWLDSIKKDIKWDKKHFK
jgi:hypothetical protein